MCHRRVNVELASWGQRNGKGEGGTLTERSQTSAWALDGTGLGPRGLPGSARTVSRRLRSGAGG